MNTWQGIFGIIFIVSLGAFIWIIIWEILDK